MDKKSSLIQGLEEYFDNTPKEELEKDLKELEPYNEYGLMFESIIKEHPILKKLNDYLSNASEEQLQKDWKELKQYQEIGGPVMEEVLCWDEQKCATHSNMCHYPECKYCKQDTLNINN